MNNEIKDIILAKTEFRARTEKGLLSDKIYPGVFRNTLFACNVGSREISQAIKENLIEEIRIRPVGQTERVGYIWLGMELKQVTFFKKSLNRINLILFRCRMKVRRFFRLFWV
jgi:hypothetical protein